MVLFHLSDCYRNIVASFVQQRSNNRSQVLVSFYKLFSRQQNRNRIIHFHRGRDDTELACNFRFGLFCYFVLTTHKSSQ